MTQVSSRPYARGASGALGVVAVGWSCGGWELGWERSFWQACGLVSFVHAAHVTVHCHAARELVHAAHIIFCATRTLIHATRILVHAAAHARHTDSGGGGGVASSYESLVVHPARVVTYSFARRTRSFTRTDPGGGSTFFAFSLSLAPPVEGRANGLCTIMHNIIRLRRFLSRPRGTTLAPAPWRGPRHTARSLKPTAELPRSHTPPRLSRPAWVSAPGRLAPASH